MNFDGASHIRKLVEVHVLYNIQTWLFVRVWMDAVCIFVYESRISSNSIYTPAVGKHAFPCSSTKFVSVFCVKAHLASKSPGFWPQHAAIKPSPFFQLTVILAKKLWPQWIWSQPLLDNVLPRLDQVSTRVLLKVWHLRPEMIII